MQTFSSKSGCGCLQEVPSVLGNWLLRRSDHLIRELVTTRGLTVCTSRTFWRNQQMYSIICTTIRYPLTPHFYFSIIFVFLKMTKKMIFFFLFKVHLFGASLGGFLAQKFAEMTYNSPRVHSLILCNAFADTSVFQQTATAAT